MKKDCHFIRPVVMGFRKDADELVISFHWEELGGWGGAKERKPTHMNTHTHGERGET